MTYILRHIAMRLWLSILVGTMLVLWCLPVVAADIDLIWVVVIAIIMLVVIFLAIGWVFNPLALKIIERLIREATIWERAGNFHQAEKIFRRAVAVFDSFLISPSSRKNKSKRLITHLARFYLARQNRDHSAETFITTYLNAYPHEKMLAEEWLQQALLQNDLTPDQQELAYRIGEAQPENLKIQIFLARFYVSTERNDYQAIQSYRRVLENDPAPDSRLTAQLADLFFQDHRTDAWALKAYVTSYAKDPKKDHLLKGMAACLHWRNGEALPPDLLDKAEGFLSHIQVSDRKRMWQGFTPPARPPVAPEVRPMANRLEIARNVVKTSLRATHAFSRSFLSALSALLLFCKSFYRQIRDYNHLKIILKWGGIGLAAAGLVVLAINTVSFLIKPKPEILVKEIQPVVVVTDPFTLQVAAYIKKEHALKYVADLKALKLDAYWTEAKGIKTQWYQVRLSHFPDKASARTYGDSLKTKGIIDDFYVANYQRP
jgi:tetratricopeptide (TPR) repeat protein